jgi:putative membrane-bound dehydrogenase-like protein
MPRFVRHSHRSWFGRSSAIALAVGAFILPAAIAQLDPSTGWIGVDLEMKPEAAAAETVVDTEPDSVERDYSKDLKRLPPTPPSKALETFEIEPGFRLEIAAAEPLVTDPVAMEFDERGRLYVVEMLGYSENAADMLGRVRLLEDADGDGRFDTSTVFTDGLAWPTAVMCYDGGVFVGSAPDILYFKDTNGDGRADVRRVVFTGFGMDNVQGLLNSFRWGLDNRIHVAVSRCVAEVRRGDQPDAPPLVLRGRNFAFDPRTLEFEATSGASQHGFCFDDWGNAFTCSNSDHIQQILIEERYLARNPYLQPPPALRSIAADGPAADVFRISPVEPWREIRTRLRVKGLVPGPIEGGGRAAGYFTSATGVTIYTGDAWPEKFRGNAFIGDVGSNLVHRKTVEIDPNAIPFVARRATSGYEFLASRDTWFRPVQFANGPDGNLYILDMYREVIEHPASLPPVLKKHLDLTSGRDRGRIYRVVHESAGKTGGGKKRPLPGEVTPDEVVKMLAHPNGWHRTTAARLLYERCGREGWDNGWEYDPLCTLLANAEGRSAGRLLALYGLASSDSLEQWALVTALEDGNAPLRAHAARLAEQRLRGGFASADEIIRIEHALFALADDPKLRVRFAAACALGDVTNPARLDALATIIRRDAGDEYIGAAVLSALAKDAEKLLAKLLADPDFTKTPAGRTFVLELARQIGARGDEHEVDALAAAIFHRQQTADAALPADLLKSALNAAGPKSAAVRQRLAKQAGTEAEALMTGMFNEALNVALDTDAKPEKRAAAVAGLTIGAFDDAQPALVELLEPRQPQSVQLAALAALGQFADADLATPVLAAWPGMSPDVRLQAAELLLSRASSAQALLAAVKDSRLSPRDLDPSTIQRLKTHADADVREQAKVLEGAGQQRSQIVDAYHDVLDLAGDPSRGREHFRKHCAICHRRENYGTEVGADLATVVTRTPEQLLIAILDPNREVDPKYIQYTVLTVDGLAASGIISAETASSVTLTAAEQKTKTIPRADIEQLQSTGMTLMPEGFEKVLDKQSMADLIAYLRSSGT